MKTIALLATLTFFCGVAACAGSGTDDGTSAGGSAYSKAPSSKSTPAPTASAKPTTPAKAPAAQAPTATDGGTSPAAKSSSLLIDGTTCTVTSTGLDTGLDGHGWTLTVEGTCPTTFTLEISGDADAPYPQTSLTPFLEEPAAILFMTTPDGNDARTYEPTVSNVGSGPTGKTLSSVTGAATVASAADGTSHSVSYSFEY